MRHLPRVVEMGWDTYLGQSDTLVPLTVLGRYPVRVQEVVVDATQAFEQALINTGYENPCDWTGSYLVRPIAGTDIWSMHSYGIAIDLDYGGGDGNGTDNNPHIHRRIRPGDPSFGVEWQLLEHQVEAVENIRNSDGDQMWRWLGWPIGDTMHFEMAVGPQFTTVDWSTVAGHEPPEDTMDYETFRTAEFDLWTDENIVEAYDAGMFQDPNRAAFIDYWITNRPHRTPYEKARFMTDYYAHLWKGCI